MLGFKMMLKGVEVEKKIVTLRVFDIFQDFDTVAIAAVAEHKGDEKNIVIAIGDSKNSPFNEIDGGTLTREFTKVEFNGKHQPLKIYETSVVNDYEISIDRDIELLIKVYNAINKSIDVDSSITSLFGYPEYCKWEYKVYLRNKREVKSMTEKELVERFDKSDVYEIRHAMQYLDIDLEYVKDIKIYEDEREAVDAHFPYIKEKDYKRLYAELEAEGEYFFSRNGLIEIICY